ncbi:hypothetical protein Tco_0374830 [Tanacetum coccineum]
MPSFKVLETQFQMFIKSQMYMDDEYVVMTRNYFLQYTQLEILEFRDTLIQHMESVKKSINERAKHKQYSGASLKSKIQQAYPLNDAQTDESDIRPINWMKSQWLSSELRIHNHSNELSSSKLVLKVVPTGRQTSTSRTRVRIISNSPSPNDRGYIKWRWGSALFQLKSDSLPHAHAQTTKTYYKHQDSRIMKAQELKTKTSAQTLIYKIFLQRYQVYQGRLLASFQDDAKYEHVGQDTRSQGGKDDQDGRIKI